MKQGGWQFDLHWQSLSQEKPVSLSDSEVKSLCNLLCREIHCKQRRCVCIVVVSCCMLNDSLTGRD